MRALLIEDDPHLGDTLRRALEAEGYLVDWLTSAEQGQAALESTEVDLMILDRRLPGISGEQWLRRLRAEGFRTPVLMLTALGEVGQRVEGLDAGADDYLGKPFDLDEVLARLRALARRRTVEPTSVLKVGELELDRASRAVRLRGETIELSSPEVSLLEKLMDNAGSYVTKSRLADSVYGFGQDVTDNAVEAMISRLRKRLGRDTIRTLRGVGYRLDP